MASKITIVNQNVAGIDVGSREIFVALCPPESSLVKVESFPTFNPDLDRCVDYLCKMGIESVCMEATGVYWVSLYEKLESARIEVYVVNGAHARNLARRKSDVADSAWLYELHSHGLLRKSFIPKAPFRRLRSHIRLREGLIQRRSSEILRMQKALELMNLKFHLVLSQTMGRSGRNIIEAILRGETDPEALLQLCHSQVISSKGEQIIKALQGNYQQEHLFALKLSLQAWDFHTQQIAQCDQAIQQSLRELTRDVVEISPDSTGKPIRHNPPAISNLHGMVLTLCGGKDIGSIIGFNDMTVVKLISFTGTDMSPWQDEKHFASWAGLTPRKAQSGSRWKRVSSKGNREVHQIFRLIAQSVGKTRGSLGDYYRRIKARRGSKIAIKALARKLACIYYRSMRYGIQYVEKGMANYNEQQQLKKEHSFIRQAKKLGLDHKAIRKMLKEKHSPNHP